MKKLSGPFPASCRTLSLAVLLAWPLTGCNTTPAPTTPSAAPSATPQMQRAAKYRADYDAQPALTQKQLSEGNIARGQDMKLVYIALGRPDVIITTPNAKIITWTYTNYLPPVIATNKVVIGDQPFQANHSPLFETMDAWNNGLQKHEIIEAGNTDIVAKSPTQSWADYGKYRKDYEMAGTQGAKDAIEQRARLEYRESLLIPPITSPDPVQLTVVFIDRQVVDVTIDESVSAFSGRALALPTAPARK